MRLGHHNFQGSFVSKIQAATARCAARRTGKEREWRIIRNFNDAAQKEGADQYGKEVLLFAIPPDCLRSMVIGYRAKPESVARLREIVARNPGLSHIQFECAAMKADGQIEILPD